MPRRKPAPAAVGRRAGLGPVPVYAARRLDQNALARYLSGNGNGGHGQDGRATDEPPPPRQELRRQFEAACHFPAGMLEAVVTEEQERKAREQETLAGRRKRLAEVLLQQWEAMVRRYGRRKE